MKKPLYYLHRVNTVDGLRKVPAGHGVEIDVRGYGSKLYLNHDPLEDNPAEKYAELEEYLKAAEGKKLPVIFNIKEAGYEQRVMNLAAKYGVDLENSFLLDVEFPYLYRVTRKGEEQRIAVRYSEAEPIEAVISQRHQGKVNGQPLLQWVWIDTNTKLPLDKSIVKHFADFRTCLVSPDRWGRPDDILPYRKQMQELGFELDAVMLGQEYLDLWTQPL